MADYLWYDIAIPFHFVSQKCGNDLGMPGLDRAAIIDYFQYSLVFLNKLIDILVHKMFENSENCPSQFPRVQGGVSKLLLLSKQQSKDKQYSIYYH